MIYSNTGFKLALPVNLVASDSSMISLPYSSFYTDADSIFQDCPHCTQVTYFNEESSEWTDYLGFDLPPVSTNFSVYSSGNLIAGRALLVKVSEDTVWDIIGVQDASSVTLYSSGIGHSGLNWISVPYNSTASDAETLFSQVPNISEVSIYNPTTDSLRIYDGASNLDNFSLPPGQGVRILVSEDTIWTPEVY